MKSRAMVELIERDWPAVFVDISSSATIWPEDSPTALRERHFFLDSTLTNTRLRVSKIDPASKKRVAKSSQNWCKIFHLVTRKMQRRKCINEKMEPFVKITRQESKEKISDLPFTMLGLYNDSRTKFNSFPRQAASLRISRSRNSTIPNSCNDDELVYAMEKFPDFFPPDYMSCSIRNSTGVEEQRHLREKLHQEDEQIDRKVLEWLHQEYGI